MSTQTRTFGRKSLAAACLLCLASVPAACLVGPLPIPAGDVLLTLAGLGPQGDSAEVARLVILDLRLPRVLLALLVGGGLAVAGAMFQGVLRNPLADPFTLGVSGGAALGAALAISLGVAGAAAGLALPLAAFAGAGVALGVVLLLSRPGRGADNGRLILAGVVVSSVLAALITLIKALDESSVTGIVYWIMGSLQNRGRLELFTALPGVLVGLATALLLHRELDLLSLGRRTAGSLGLPIGRILPALLAGAGLMAASCVAVSGIIGFVGLIVPHLFRLCLGPLHRRLLPACFVGGGLLLIWTDTAARAWPAGGVELPVGALTALLGGPFFCFLLQRKSGPALAPAEAEGSFSAQGVADADAHHGPTRNRASAGVADGVPDVVADGTKNTGIPACDAGSPTIGAPACIDFRPSSHTPRRVLPAGVALEARNLVFAYGTKPVLRGLDVVLAPGESAALLGPNGCGKSTLLACLAGELRPESGAVVVNRLDPARLPERRRARLAAFLPQQGCNPPGISVFQSVLMGRYAHTRLFGGYSQEDRDATQAVLAAVGLEAFARRDAGRLSGGEARRVLLARALAQEAPLLLLDEAEAGLDPACRTAVFTLVAELRRQNGPTVLAAMHDINAAALFFDRLIFMKEGRILADGPPREVMRQEVLEAVYETPVALLPHPQTGVPQMFAQALPQLVSQAFSSNSAQTTPGAHPCP